VIDALGRRFSVDEGVRRHQPAQEAYHSVAIGDNVAGMATDPAKNLLSATKRVG
jgi:hypothetical protein